MNKVAVEYVLYISVHDQVMAIRNVVPDQRKSEEGYSLLFLAITGGTRCPQPSETF